MENLKQEERVYLTREFESGEIHQVENALQARFFADMVQNFQFLHKIDGTL